MLDSLDVLVQAGVTSAREVEELLAGGNTLYAGQTAVIGRADVLTLGATAGVETITSLTPEPVDDVRLVRE